MSIIQDAKIGNTPFEKLLGHCPAILDSWSQLEQTFFQSPTFTPHFLEQVRRALAFKNECHYCMAKAGPPEENKEDARLTVALRFANQFAIDHLALGEAEIEYLKQFFTDSEIAEFLAFCCFISASQRFGAVLKLGAGKYATSAPF